MKKETEWDGQCIYDKYGRCIFCDRERTDWTGEEE